ncbi:MAG: LLM class flavin-dependent oxidoreductase [Dehalococcoidia bacterium]
MAAPHVSVMIRGWDVRANTTGAQVIASAKLAEEVGLDGVLTGDHVTFCGFGFDGLQTLTAVAAATDRVTLKTGVYLLPLRHPVPVALQVAALDQLSFGRFVFGVGIGGEDPHEFTSCGVDPRFRGARCNEALQIVRRLWTEDNVTFQGRHFDLHDVTLYPKPLGHVPIYIGGRSDAALRRAGRYGDGYTGIWQSLDRFCQLQEVIAEAAVAAGRDPAAIELGMQFWMAVDEDRSRAHKLVSRGMESTYRLPFDRFERYTPFGSAEEVAAFIAPYVEAGAKHVNLLPVQGSPEANVEAAARVREALEASVGVSE